MTTSSDVLICGAGIAGIAAAYHLAARQGVKNVLLVDERPPLTLTSDKSTEAYRNWWPGPDAAMIRLMNRSIDLLDELAQVSRNRFLLNRRGYVYATSRPEHVEILRQTATQAEQQGAGPLRLYTGSPTDPIYQPHPAEGFDDQPTGADLLLDPALIRQHFPYLADDALAVLHTRRCGWFSGQQLGMLLLELAQEAGVRFQSGTVEGVRIERGRIAAVRVSGQAILTGVFVNAAGPFLKRIGQMIGVNLPVFSERHVKLSFKDHQGVIPRNAPLLIWDDPQTLDWSDDEREILAESDSTRPLSGELPSGVHCRPEGGHGSQNVLILWPYDAHPVDEVFPLPDVDPLFAEVALRGMARMIPGLCAYLGQRPRPYIDGGYYTKTRENRLLCGPMGVEGAYVVGALSGYGLMAALGAGELLSSHITGGSLPEYAPAFALSRYDDLAYRQKVEAWGATGQL